MDKKLEQQIIDSLEDLEIEDKIPEYQVWAFVYEADRPEPDELLVKSFTDPQKAIDHAKVYTETLAKSTSDMSGHKIERCEIMVETVIDFEDYEENIATLYHEILEF